MIRVGFLLTVLFAITACIPKQEPEVVIIAPPPVEEKEPEPSPEPLVDVSKGDILFAQTALKQMGYLLGPVDGLWGPQSAAALRGFELKHSLWSTNGRLSELNLTRLGEMSGLSRNIFQQKQNQSPERVRAITRKLDKSQPLTKAPQLIIVDKAYEVLAKPNPYSSKVSRLLAGTGVYVISRQEGNWYEIESLDQVRGFILDN